MNKDKMIVCYGARCSVWGAHFKRHWYDNETDDCYRCGMSRKEQWEEDKFAGLVSGVYVERLSSEQLVSKGASS